MIHHACIIPDFNLGEVCVAMALGFNGFAHYTNWSTLNRPVFCGQVMPAREMAQPPTPRWRQIGRDWRCFGGPPTANVIHIH